MIPRGLLPGRPIDIKDVRVGDIVDAYSPEHSGYRWRQGKVYRDTRIGCDLEVMDHIGSKYNNMSCKHFGDWIQLRRRAGGEAI